MAEITAASVKELRERTGAGMMDCKKALAETGGEMEPAVDWLRAKGLAAAAKKAGKIASAGSKRGRRSEVELTSTVDVNSEEKPTVVQAVAERFKVSPGTVQRAAKSACSLSSRRTTSARI